MDGKITIHIKNLTPRNNLKEIANDLKATLEEVKEPGEEIIVETETISGD